MTESSASASPYVPSLLITSWERLGLLPTDRVPLWRRTGSLAATTVRHLSI